MPSPKASGSTITTRSNSRPLVELRGQRSDAGGLPEVASDHAADAFGVGGEPRAEDRAQLGRGRVPHGDPGPPDGRRHVGVGERSPDDRLRLDHHLRGRAVVDAQRGQLDGVETDPRKALLPRLRETVPGLGAVADDGEAARRAAEQQHLPLGVGQLLRLVHDDVRERPGQQVSGPARAHVVVGQGGLEVLATQHRHHVHVGVVGGDQVVDHLGHLLPVGRRGGPPTTPAP